MTIEQGKTVAFEHWFMGPAATRLILKTVEPVRGQDVSINVDGYGDTLAKRDLDPPGEAHVTVDVTITLGELQRLVDWAAGHGIHPGDGL